MAGWLKAATDFFIFGLCDVLLRPVHSTFSESAALLASPKVDIVGSFIQVCAMVQRTKRPLSELWHTGFRGVNESAGLEVCLGNEQPSSSLLSLVQQWADKSLRAPDARRTHPGTYDWPAWMLRQRLPQRKQRWVQTRNGTQVAKVISTRSLGALGSAEGR